MLIVLVSELAVVAALPCLVELFLHVLEVDTDLTDLLRYELVTSACQIWQYQTMILMLTVAMKVAL